MAHVDVANTFFTMLTLLANAAVVLVVVLALAASVSGRARRVAGAVVDAVGPSARLVASLVAAVATVGSLYYSEVAGFVPCRLCWYQRICMYPLAVVLLVGLVLRDPRTRVYAAPFVVVGAPLSLYHWLVERGVLSEGGACSLEAPCAVPWFEELGYVTLAFMAMSAFALVGTLLVAERAWERRTGPIAGTTDAGDHDEWQGHHGADDRDAPEVADPARGGDDDTTTAGVPTMEVTR